MGEDGAVSQNTVPSYESVKGADLPTLYGLIASHEPSTDTEFEFAWQRDRARMDAVEAALSDLAAGATHVPVARPRWLDGLVRADLRRASESYWARERFAWARLLERIGAVQLEADDTYVLAMLSGLGGDKPNQLREDPELVERAVWRLFEVEGGGEVSLTNVDRFSSDTWRTTFLELTSDGTLERSRALRECLLTLGRDFLAYRAGWFRETFLALSPTVDEVAGLQPELRRLLGSAIPATVAFAVKQLRTLEKAGRLDVADALTDLGAATLVRTKGTALDALRLARSARAERPDLVADVATAALGHPHADVQRAAVDLLRECGQDGVLADAAADLAPSVRAESGLDAPPAEATKPAAPRTQPLREPATLVAPDELAERVAGLLEDASDPGELEATLAALAVSKDVGILAPLAKRARRVAALAPDFSVGQTTVSAVVARTVLALLGEPGPTGMPPRGVQRFLAHRMGEVRAGDGPLLATPDLPGGWLSPSALVERLSQTTTPRHHDLVAALLRLHPDGRDGLASKDHPPAVRFALTGDQPRWRRGPEAWSVAAYRSRAPYDEVERPTLSSTLKSYEWQVQGRTRTARYLEFTVAIATPRGADDRPTETGTGRIGQYDDLALRSWDADWVEHLAAIWPHDAEHFLTYAALSVLGAAGHPEVAHDVPRTLDALAAHPGRMGTLATNALAAGLAAEHRTHRFHAADAFADLVPTGRIKIADVAGVLAANAEAWTVSRWTETLASCAAAPGAAAAVVDLLTTLLPQLPTSQRGINKALDLLREESLRQGRPVTDPTLRAWLDRFTGSSTSARAARAMLG